MRTRGPADSTHPRRIFTSAIMSPAAPHPIEAVIFDLDGLLIDSEPFWAAAEVDVFRSLGVDFALEECVRTRGMRIDEVVRFWRLEKGWRAPSDEEVVERILDQVVAQIRSAGAPRPGVNALFQRLASYPVVLGLASSSPERIIAAALDRLGLRARLKAVCSAEHEARGKPDPAVYLTAARELRVSPERCLVFEDARAGLDAARAAGMRCIVVPSDAAETDWTGASRTLASLADFDDDTWRAVTSMKP